MDNFYRGDVKIITLYLILLFLFFCYQDEGFEALEIFRGTLPHVYGNNITL